DNYPSSEVLGLGKNIPSALYVLISIACFAIGVTSVAKSNLITPLTPESINPQYVVGSLLLPISWGAHTAAFIQKVNKK
nr:Chain R2, PsaR [Porphyridium purpureum]7Y5E_RN Chain RN, PsaR [Porphyridium purpureum]